MELYNLKLYGTKFDVVVIDDYKIKGSFDPNSPSDTDFYGYRETVFDVTSTYNEALVAGYSLYLPNSKEVTDEFAKYFDNEITLIVQNALDEKDIDG